MKGPLKDDAKPHYCVRCRSLWGKLWALCQRCGFHASSPNATPIKVEKKSRPEEE